MNISYVTTYNARDVNNWSGLGRHIAKSLEFQNAKIEYIGNLKFEKNFSTRLKSFYYSRIVKKGYFPDRTFYVANQYAIQIDNVLNRSTEIIFSPGTIPIAYLETKKPKVFYTDATFAGMLDFYDSFTNLSKETIKDGNKLEQAAFDTCQLFIYSSAWAAQTAVLNYKVDTNKIKIVPFGANIVGNRDLESVREGVKTRNTKKCHLLFVGVDWFRKNGELAYEVALKLNKSGLDTELHVLGINELPLNGDLPFIVNHGFISKNTKDGLTKISQIISGSHFLILPSIADCTTLVFPEANSFGVPCLTTNVGGIPTIIKNGVNGHMFPIDSFVNDCHSYVLNLFYNYSEYEELALSS